MRVIVICWGNRIPRASKIFLIHATKAAAVHYSVERNHVM
jgi:hypothetical protein